MRIDQRIKEATNSLRTSGETPGIEAATLTMTFPQSRSRRVWLRPTGVVACALIGVATGVLLLTPSRAVGLAEIQLALKSVPASHSRFYTMDGNVTFESWQEGTKRRYKIGDQIDRGYNDKVVWYVHPKDKYAVISGEDPFGFGYDGTSIENDLKSHQWETIGEPAVSRREVVLNGEKILEVTIKSRPKKKPNEFRKSVIFCRLSDNLPVRANHYSIKDGKEKQNGYYINEYPSDMPDSFFDPSIPSGVIVLDEKAAYDQILSRLSNPAYRKTVAGVPITLLGIFTSRTNDSWSIHGDAFVLFTGGAIPHIDSKAGLLNEKGRGYSASLYCPSDDVNRPRNHGIEKAPQRDQAVAKKKRHGDTPDFPQHIRPLFKLQGQQVYGLHFSVEKDRWRTPWEVTTILPASMKTLPRVVRVGTRGVYVQGDGKQVGSVKFTDTAIAVPNLHTLIQQFDRRVNSTHYMPIKGINVPPSKGFIIIKRLAK